VFTPKNCIKLIYPYFHFRCGGQGDILSGALALFLFWATRHPECPEPGPGRKYICFSTTVPTMVQPQPFSPKLFLILLFQFETLCPLLLQTDRETNILAKIFCQPKHLP